MNSIDTYSLYKLKQMATERGIPFDESITKLDLLVLLKADGGAGSSNHTKPLSLPFPNNETGIECLSDKRLEPHFDISRLTLGSDIANGDYAVSYIVDKLIPENAVTLFYAKGGSGKSTIVTQVAGAVTVGMSIFGLNTSKRPVVIIDYENPFAVLKKRIDLVEGAGSIYFWTSRGIPPQLHKTEWQELKELVCTLKNPLLIIDTLSSSCSNLDILSNGDFSPVMQRIIELRNLGATIILLHHTPKQDETKYIGASCIYNQADHIIAMYPVKKAGVENEAIDDDDAKVYRLGTKDKTRFAHFAMHVEFDEDKGIFIPATDPDNNILERLTAIIAEQQPVNQSTIIKTICATPAPPSEKKLKRLLKNHEGVLWSVKKGLHNSWIYNLIQLGSNSPPYKGKTAKLETGQAGASAELHLPDTTQLPGNSELGSYSSGSDKLEKQSGDVLNFDF